MKLHTPNPLERVKNKDPHIIRRPKFLYFITLLLFALLPVATCFSQTIDLKILKSINQHDYPRWDKSMEIVSFSAYPAIVLVPSGILAYGYAKKDDVMIRNGYKTLISIGLNQLLTSGIKWSVSRKRPFVQYPNDIIKRTNVSDFSFPSGHTSSAFTLATSLTLSTKKWQVAVPSYLYACAVGYSRMRLGVHFPSDVLGGMVVGIGSTFLVWQMDKWMNGK